MSKLLVLLALLFLRHEAHTWAGDLLEVQRDKFGMPYTGRIYDEPWITQRRENSPDVLSSPPLSLIEIPPLPQWDGAPFPWTPPAFYPQYYAPNFPGQQYFNVPPSDLYGPVYERRDR